MSKKHPLLYEPTTTLTDYAIFLLGLYFSWKTYLVWESQGSLFHLLWGGSFLSVAISGFLGGTSHGFGPKFESVIKKILWRLTLIFVGITGLLLAMSAATFFISEGTKLAMFVTAGALLIVYFFRIKKDDAFRSAVSFYLPLVLLSLILFLIVFYNGRTGALLIAIGLIVSLAAAGVQRSGLILHQHFNHNDLYHVVQMLGMVLMFTGGLEIPPQ